MRSLNNIMTTAMWISLAAVPLIACGVALTAQDRAQIALDATNIARCQAIGRQCKAADAGDCYGQYDACMRDAGLR